MALNQRYTHNVHISLTADKDYKSGDPVLIGGYAGVAKISAKTGERVTVWLDGSYDMEVDGALTEGQVVNIKTDGSLTSSAGKPWGISNIKKGAGKATAEVAPLGRTVPTAATGG